MVTVIRSMKDLKKQVDIACSRAVKNAADILLKELQKYIQEDYYQMYSPIYYHRTMAFYQSAIANMINNTTATVGIDELYMSYQYPAQYNNLDGSSGHWTGEDQVYMADAGYHGSAYIYRDGHFWKDFEQWCNKNCLKILRQEFKKQGINVK